MSQPAWECIAQLGDKNPIDHGGYWILRDTTGVYAEEAELLLVPDDDDREYTIYRFTLDRCTFVNGVVWLRAVVALLRLTFFHFSPQQSCIFLPNQ